MPVCESCLDAIGPIEGIVCEICGEPVQGATAQSTEVCLCGLCRKKAPPFAKAVAYGSYSDNLRELIHLLKYDQVLPATKVLGKFLAEAIAKLEPQFESKQVLVVPVPLYKGKRRQRGFNQAESITRVALKCRNSELFVLRPKVLERVRPTKSQIGLTRHQRRENMRGAFGMARADEVSGREILLTDDVFTTGTTVAECARVLLRAGASKVWVATVARTLKTEIQTIEMPTWNSVPIAG